MTPEQIKAIEQSFAKVTPISEQAALFAAYGILSEYMVTEAYGRSAAAE